MKVLIVGLTGGIVSGKTTVAQFFEQLGAKIIDADKIAREIVCPQQKVWKNIVKHFGADILKYNQEIDRKKLAQIVFSNKDKLDLLNRITHPEIIAIIKKQIRKIKKDSDGDVICVIDVPLLFEAKMEHMMDRIIVVYLNQEEQEKRLLLRDGLKRTGAIKRIESQIPMKEKIHLADYVIDNCLTLDYTKKQVFQIWAELNKILTNV